MNNNFLEFVKQINLNETIKNILQNLQQRLKINSNIFLFCCWFAKQGCRSLNKKELQSIITTITPWHNQIIIALQKMYLDSKKVNQQVWQENISNKILDMEVTAQQMEQIMIHEAIAKASTERTATQKIADACKSISGYCKELQIALDQQDTKEIKQLLIYIFPESNYDALTSYWGNSTLKHQKAFSYLQQQLEDL
jgi:hypothetical protein